jgi:hypothetical protein
MSRIVRIAYVFACLAPSGCGLLIDARRNICPEPGDRWLPTGQIKYDIWGHRYVEPYPWLLDEARKSPRPEKGTGNDN